MNRKYFIAIVLPEPAQSKAEAIKQEIQNKFGLKGALRSPSHITIHRPFEWKSEKEVELINSLNEFEFSNPFRIVLNNFNSFEPRVIYIDVLENDRLHELHESFKQFSKMRLKLLNETNDLRGFHPHVTMAFRDLKKNRFQEVWEYFRDKTYHEEFVCSQLSLLRLDEKWKVISEISFNKKAI